MCGIVFIYYNPKALTEPKMKEFLLRKTFGPDLFPHILSVGLCNTPPYQCSISGHTPCQTLASAQHGAIWAATTGRSNLPTPGHELALLSPLALLVWPCPVLSSLATPHLLNQVSHHTHKQLITSHMSCLCFTSCTREIMWYRHAGYWEYVQKTVAGIRVWFHMKIFCCVADQTHNDICLLTLIQTSCRGLIKLITHTHTHTYRKNRDEWEC